MKFSVAALVLWSRDDSKPPRILRFSERGINLVTGSSRSGKSAIIKIMDYCLGSGGCNIPKLGPIRRSCAWYGIVIGTEQGYKLLARRDPGEQDSTDDYMLVESTTITIPQRASKNAVRATVLGVLARLARLPQVDSDFHEGGSGFKGRASFGDMTAFMFQPQNIVANESVLFFEADEEIHARKIREVFPLVLGAIDADTLVKQHRLAELRRQLDKLKQRRDAMGAALKEMSGEVRGRFLTALELGLLPGSESELEVADIGVLLARLNDVVAGWPPEKRDEPNSDQSSRVAIRLAELRQRDGALAARVASLRVREVQLRELGQAKRTAERAISRERERLSATSWLLAKVSQPSDCPFCGAENHRASEELTRLREHTANVEAQWRGIESIPPMLDAEQVEVRRSLSSGEESLRQVRAERVHLEALTIKARKDEQERAVFIGRLSEFLLVQRAITGDKGLDEQIATLHTEDQRLRADVDPDAIAQKKEDALLLISRYAQEYGDVVELETKSSLIMLDIKALTIRIVSERGQSAWLSQIGSGANHLGYHVAMLLALHEFFIARGIPYVPTFLALDQPSQTQFPDDLDEEAEQEELLAVRKAFEAFDLAVDRTSGELQIIVSEHAGKTVYAGIRNITIVERWRRGRKLVPWHWDAEALAAMKGKRADFALQDIEAEVALAIVQQLNVDEKSVESVRLEGGVFQDLGIAFSAEIRVSAARDEETPERAGQTSPRTAKVQGLVRIDLSVELVGFVP